MPRRPAPVLGLFWLAGGVLLGTALGPVGWGRLVPESYRSIVLGEPAELAAQAAQARAEVDAARQAVRGRGAGAGAGPGTGATNGPGIDSGFMGLDDTARLGAAATLIDAGARLDDAEQALEDRRDARSRLFRWMRDGAVLLLAVCLAGWSASRRPGGLRSAASVGVYAMTAVWLALWLARPPWLGG
ncbi:MAG: hypothetical protein AAF288_13990 [Planctomycetota bacterium]